MEILRCLPPGPHSRGFKGSQVRHFGQRRQVGEILQKKLNTFIHLWEPKEGFTLMVEDVSFKQTIKSEEMK